MIPPRTHTPSPGTVSWGLDTQPLKPKDHVRRSIKLKSKRKYTVGEDQPLRSMLTVIDVAHVPTGCGTWPAFWMANEASWPKYGEIDIIESTNRETVVSTTLHTCGAASAKSAKTKKQCSGATNCTMESIPETLFTGTWHAGKPGGAPKAYNCDIDAPGQYSNQGCSIDGAHGSAGSTLNDGNGGIFATEWSMKDLSNVNASYKGQDLDPLDVPHIAMWFFPRKDLPLSDEKWGAQPDTKAWGPPYAYFRLGTDSCNPKHFRDLKIIFDTTLCGDNAGNKWDSSGCSQAGARPSCEEFVLNNGGDLTDAYWEIHNVSVWGVTTGVPWPRPHENPTVPMAKYVIIGGVSVGVCIVCLCGWRCWMDAHEARDRTGRKAGVKERLRNTSSWEDSHENHGSGGYGKAHRWQIWRLI